MLQLQLEGQTRVRWSKKEWDADREAGSGFRFSERVRRLKPLTVPCVLGTLRTLHTVRGESGNTGRVQVMKSFTC